MLLTSLLRHLTEHESAIRAHFRSAEVQCIGFTAGCGCDFPHVLLQNGEWPIFDLDDAARVATLSQNRRALTTVKTVRLECNAMQIPGAFPKTLKLWWVSASPLAFLFAARILWEKTILTWSEGPQMVGFALWHVHPAFAVVGTLCSLALAVWLLIAVPYAIVRRRDIEPWDWLMMAGTVLVILVLSVPDTFFASGR